jgi:alpha-amylase
VAACFTAFATIDADASSCTISPSNPVAGQSVTVTYNRAGGPLAGGSTIQIHRGINYWSAVAGPDQAMTFNAATGNYTVTYTVPEAAYNLNFAFNNGAGTWDNNNTADWHFAVIRAPAPSPLPASPALPTNASIANVMMQGFYWDNPSGWYNTMAGQASVLRNMRGGHGIDRIWFPPPQKSDSGPFSMGYDPYDYYDLGQFNQKGTIPTHHGTQADLKNAIAAFRAQGIVCMADVVLNHRAGGASESNPNLSGASTPTDFRRVASGQCTWRYNQFNPSTFENSDEGSFSSYPDVYLSLATSNSIGWPRYDLIQWGNWLMNSANAGFDGGWRFDFVKGFRPSMVGDFRAGTGNAFGIIECWDSNVTNVDAWVTSSRGTAAFDFPAYFTMEEVLTRRGSIGGLVDPAKVYAARNPSKAVTFVANHDTDTISKNKMLAYAFILTYRGYPCIFWKDYFNNGLATLGGQSGNGINALVWVRGALSGGQPSIELLQTGDPNLLVYGTLNGTASAPGYIIAINKDSTATRSVPVTTANSFLRGKTLQCYAWYSYGDNTQPANVSCSSSGVVTVRAKRAGYAVYSPVKCSPPAAPTGLSATPGDAQVSLNWTASAGATSYNVKRATNSSGPYTTIATGVTTTSYTNTGVVNGTTHYFVINAVNSCGTSGDSAYLGTMPTAGGGVPATPTGLTASPGNAQVTLSWTASSGASSYNVKRATVSGGPYTVIATNVTSLSYTNTGLVKGTTYYYVVSAVNSSGESTNSTQASATPSAGSSPPAPTGLTATATGNDKDIRLTWTASTGATSYNIKRATVSGGPFTIVKAGQATSPYADQTPPASNTTYYYVVSAVNASGETPNSNQASATTP